MTTNHTPGPWTSVSVPVSGPSAIREIKSENGLRLALVGIYGTTKTPDVSECVANARLIAAAPDLLAALTRLLDEQPEFDDQGNFTSNSPASIQARAAIDKATRA